MNTKRFIGASVAVFLVFEVLDFIIHAKLLSPTYQSLAHLWRPDMMSKMWLMHGGMLVFSFLFVYIFSKGYEGKGIAEGFRYGLVMGLLFSVPSAIHEYVIYPLPGSLCAQWLIYGLIEFVICGLVTAALYPFKK